MFYTHADMSETELGSGINNTELRNTNFKHEMNSCAFGAHKIL